MSMSTKSVNMYPCALIAIARVVLKLHHLYIYILITRNGERRRRKATATDESEYPTTSFYYFLCVFYYSVIILKYIYVVGYFAHYISQIGSNGYIPRWIIILCRAKDEFFLILICQFWDASTKNLDVWPLKCCRTSFFEHVEILWLWCYHKMFTMEVQSVNNIEIYVWIYIDWFYRKIYTVVTQKIYTNVVLELICTEVLYYHFIGFFFFFSFLLLFVIFSVLFFSLFVD